MSTATARAARAMTNRAFGEPATHLRTASGGPACGQTALGGRGLARTRYTDDPARVTCRKCCKTAAKNTTD